MNILVTGGAGYIGSHTVQALLAAGHRVVIYDDLMKGHVDALPENNDQSKFFLGNIADRKFVESVIKDEKIEAVVHFAAASLVGESQQYPAFYYNNNVAGTLALVDTLISTGVNKLVFSSTAAVYGEPVTTPITEEAVLCPTNVYGRTKFMIEQLLADYSAAYGLNYVALRYFNAAGAAINGLIGEDHEPETHLIPLILQTALGNRPAIAIYGTDYPTADGTCIRDYVHVCDLADAHVLALNHLLTGGKSRVYNLGSEHGYSVREIIAAAKRVTGIDFAVTEQARRSGDPAILVASSQKISRELHWQPRYSDITRIIRSAWEWHQSYPDGYGDD